MARVERPGSPYPYHDQNKIRFNDSVASIPRNDSAATAIARASAESSISTTRTAWIQCACCFTMWMNSWGLVNIFGAFQTFYTQTKLSGHSDSEIAWIGSLQLALLGIGGIIVGPLYDVGYARSLTVAGNLLVVFGLCMTSICNTYWQLVLSQGICVGLGVGALFPLSVTILPAYFKANRGLAMGVAATGASIGGIVYSIMFEELRPMIGFAWTVRIIALVVLSTAILPIIAARKKKSEHVANRNIIDVTAFREPAFVFFEIGSLLYFTGMYVPFFYSQSLFGDVTDSMSTGTVARYTVVFLNVGSLFGRVIPGYLTDKIGPLLVTLIFSLCVVVLAFAWLAVHGGAGIVVFCLFYGFASGAAATANPTTLASLCPDMRVIGVRMGMNLTIFGLGGLLGNPIAGAILGVDPSGDGLKMFCGAVIAASSVFTAAAVLCGRRTRTNDQGDDTVVASEYCH